MWKVHGGLTELHTTAINSFGDIYYNAHIREKGVVGVEEAVRNVK